MDIVQEIQHKDRLKNGLLEKYPQADADVVLDRFLMMKYCTAVKTREIVASFVSGTKRG